MTPTEVLARFDPPYNLHFGCGPNAFPGWINIDTKDEGKADLVWDLSNDLPLPVGSVAFIYHEHVLEHFPVEEGVALLKRSLRLMQPGGVMRIAMPDLEYLARKYLSRRWRDQEWLSWAQFHTIGTPCEMLNAALRWWDHKWVYDKTELARRAREAGYSKVTFPKWGKSAYPQLAGRETRGDSKLIAEISK